MNIRLTKEQKIKILNSTDVYSIMQQVLMRENKIGRNKEHFWVVGLSNINKILYIELVSLGSIKTTVVDPMDVYSWALQKSCVKLIFVHNHPGGELKPSEVDKDITDRMIQVGRIVNIKVIDHFIITEKKYYSFADSGLFAKLEVSMKFVVPYLQESRMKEAIEKGVKERQKIVFEKGQKAGLREGQRAGIEKGRIEGKKDGLREGEKTGIEKNKLEIAKKMLSKSMDIKHIITFTGLSKKEIEKLSTKKNKK